MRSDITNDTQLQEAMAKDVQIAIDRTTQRLEEELKKIIKKVVYEAGTPEAYERTMQFLEMWKAKASTIIGNEVVGYVEPDYGTLKTNRSKQQHIITGETLVDLIIQGWEDKWREINQGRQIPYYVMPRNFWDEFMSYANTNAERIFMEEMNNVNNVSFGISFD